MAQSPILQNRYIKKMLHFLLLLTLIFIAFAVFLYFWQSKMIYFPQTYLSEYKRGISGVTELTFETSQGTQHAFYLPPKADASQPPDQLWVMTGGNAMSALDWLGFVESLPDEKVGFLLLDYPGYGASEGHPSRDSILELQEAVLPVLAQHLNIPDSDLTSDLNVMGYSLGCSPALEMAVRQPVKRVVLIAPFTSLLDMAHRQVGWPLKYVLKERFDNVARLDELEGSESPPAVAIIHGDADRVVPFAMGRELADKHEFITRFHHIPGAGHEGLLDIARDEIIEGMAADLPVEQKSARPTSPEN